MTSSKEASERHRARAERHELDRLIAEHESAEGAERRECAARVVEAELRMIAGAPATL